jgi:exosortase
MADKPTTQTSTNRLLFVSLAVALAALAWAYWTTLEEMAERWSSDPQYSHGYLVPVFALLLLWLRRDMLAGAKLRPAWSGLLVLAIAAVIRLAGAFYHFVWFDEIALLPLAAGLLLLAGGWEAWRWAWPAILFLGFMVPLPYRFGVAMADPLRRIATAGSTFLLQALGRPALAEGNVILLNDIKLDVVDACSGLRMLMIFFALAAAVAFVIQRPMWEKLVVIASAMPIALLVNIIRIAATGLVQEHAGQDAAKTLFHDLAGWLMMPVALALLAAELWVLRHLWIETDFGLPRRSRGAARPLRPEPQALAGSRKVTEFARGLP